MNDEKKGFIKAIENADDKDLVIIAATAIAIIAMFVLTDPQTIVSNVVTGLFGVAVGKAL